MGQAFETDVDVCLIVKICIIETTYVPCAVESNMDEPDFEFEVGLQPLDVLEKLVDKYLTTRKMVSYSTWTYANEFFYLWGMPFFKLRPIPDVPQKFMDSDTVQKSKDEVFCRRATISVGEDAMMLDYTTEEYWQNWLNSKIRGLPGMREVPKINAQDSRNMRAILLARVCVYLAGREYKPEDMIADVMTPGYKSPFNFFEKYGAMQYDNKLPNVITGADWQEMSGAALTYAWLMKDDKTKDIAKGWRTCTFNNPEFSRRAQQVEAARLPNELRHIGVLALPDRSKNSPTLKVRAFVPAMSMVEPQYKCEAPVLRVMDVFETAKLELMLRMRQHDVVNKETHPIEAFSYYLVIGDSNIVPRGVPIDQFISGYMMMQLSMLPNGSVLKERGEDDKVVAVYQGRAVNVPYR